MKTGPTDPNTIQGLNLTVVNRPLNGCCMDSCPKVTANRVSVANLEELLLQQYDHDFSESSEDNIEYLHM